MNPTFRVHSALWLALAWSCKPHRQHKATSSSPHAAHTYAHTLTCTSLVPFMLFPFLFQGLELGVSDDEYETVQAAMDNADRCGVLPEAGSCVDLGAARTVRITAVE